MSILFGKQQSGYILAEVSRGIVGLLERKSIFDTKTIEDVSNDDLDGTVIGICREFGANDSSVVRLLDESKRFACRSFRYCN